MILTTTDYISGKDFEILGIVTGSTVQTVHAGKDIFNSFKTLVGGELTSYKEMMDTARKLSTERMLAEASSLNADAVISIRLATSSVMQGASEIIVYGTAVKFK